MWKSRYTNTFGLESSGRFRSSRKGKKSNSEKPAKQPQRGLGVAQLEKIRLQSRMKEYVSSLNSSFHNDRSRHDLLFLSLILIISGGRFQSGNDAFIVSIVVII
ncbi:protein SPEAR1 [Canna indica]|uniref:Protein SPEAR1 n=1 Tax=Canna indica TaxID=4628 RepID=A0AAQ3QA89_9LILI|nr:protein SPEAR1 [Canna indica]